MTRKAAIVALLAIVASITGCSDGSTPSVNRDDDDRPPIIVTNGSINFDDGDSNSKPHWKDWTQANGNSPKQWTQNYRNGPDVGSFTVTIAGSSDSTCNVTTTLVSAVAIEYTANAGGKSLVTLQRVEWSSGANKVWEPWITAPGDMSASPSNGNSPARLVYDAPGKGYISYVTLTTSSAPRSCPFAQGASGVSISIQPVK